MGSTVSRVTYTSDTPADTYQVDEEYHVGLDDENVEVFDEYAEAMDYAVEFYLAWQIDLHIWLVSNHYDCFGDLIAVTKELMEVDDL